MFELGCERTDPDLPVCLFELEFEKSSADSNIGFVEEGAKMLSGPVYNVAALGQVGKNLREPVTVVSPSAEAGKNLLKLVAVVASQA